MVEILNIPFYDGSFSNAVTNIINQCIQNKNIKLNKCISATGAHGLVLAKKNKEFANILRGCYYNLPDGMPGVWIGWLKGAKEMQRCYGPDFFKQIIIESANKPITHYFCGGEVGIADKLKIVCKKNFKNYNCVGTYSPPFRDMKEDEFKKLGEDINDKKTDIVWIGLSTPKQELFGKKLAQFINVHFIITVGAAFDFHTGKVKQAPEWIQNIGMEWLFRLCMEPKRLYKRYFKIVPLFILYNIKEFVFYKLKRS